MNIKYILYARKSQDSEDRQVQSIDDQVEYMNQSATRLGLEVVDTLVEAHSAKKPRSDEEPNIRPQFYSLLERIEAGEANGILCWKLNRLSRNPIDSGKLSWMLQQGIIESIQTYERQYLPTDNVLLFNVETGMANQYVLDLSKDVKRGMKSKVNEGWMPGPVPTGYLNDKIEKTIISDPDRFHLMKRAWKMMLTGNYSVPEILDVMTNEWGYKTVKKKKSGGKPLSRSGLYSIFTNPFYAGIIKSGENEGEGKHEPMVTPDEYDYVQKLLGARGCPRKKPVRDFDYTKLMRCGECKCMITAESKKKHIKSTNSVREYIYYHCTHKKSCSQKKSLTKKKLEKQMITEVERYDILPQFLDWALEALAESNDTEIEDRNQVYQNLQNTLNESQQALDELTRMRYRKQIDNEIFEREKEALEKEVKGLRKQIKLIEERADGWLETTENTFKFAERVKERFDDGEAEVKRDILLALGSNFYIQDQQLTVEPYDWYEPVIKKNAELKERYARLEPKKTPMTKAKRVALDGIRQEWYPREDSNL
ncbi:recombinase family protein [candidate division WWE3 bacterium]|uniref:Recombinase family protein n=1 Tax=candidate division WWE3 bacterium TaxID=2053526 RepID=A0A955LG60_UNCKA|nr:recombinase family protein [candidate division WWE3 bacterium]